MGELTYERLLELFAETRVQFAESRVQFAESDRRYQEQRIETDKRIEKVNRELSRKIADLGDTLGRFAEEQVRADLINKFEKWGIPVHAVTNHFVQKSDSNDFLYEVDILVYNSEYVIALEVKNNLKKDHVDEHLERLEKVQLFPMVGLGGKKLLGGVAAMIVSEGVDKYAESKGLFVLKPSGDTVKIMNDRKTFKPKEWEVK